MHQKQMGSYSCVSFGHGQQMEYGLEVSGKDEDGPSSTVAAISRILTKHKYKYAC